MRKKTVTVMRAKLAAGCVAWVIAALAPFAQSASAHEQKVAISEVLFNPNTGNIEIAHRINLHDAEHAVQEQWGTSDLLTDPEDLEKLALYTRGNFFMWLNGEQVTPAPVGVEVDGIYVWIYDEYPIPAQPVKTLTIDNSILRDVWEKQANLVNVEIGKFRKSAFFAGADREKVIEIVSPD